MAEASLEAIRGFLSVKRIAVVGASRNPKDFNTAVLREFRKCGYDAVPVNPKAAEIDGLPCFESVQAIQPPAEAALLMTPPDVTATVARDCVQAGIHRVWMYRAGGTGAINVAGAEYCRKNGVDVIEGQCPLMFLPGTAWFHRFHGFVMKIARAYPR